MVTQIQNISSGVIEGVAMTQTKPMMGVWVVTFHGAVRARAIVDLIEDSGFFHLSLRNLNAIYVAHAFCPTAIGTVHLCVPEEYLENVEKVYYIFQKYLQIIYLASLCSGLINSIKYQQRKSLIFHSSAMVGALATLGAERGYLSDGTYRKTIRFFSYLEGASSFYLANGLGERIAIILWMALWTKLDTSRIVFRFQAENITPVRKFMLNVLIGGIFGRQSRNWEVILDPYTYMVGQFDSVAIQEGTTFLSTQIYDKMTQEEKELFSETDANLIYYVLSKSVYLYAFGENKDKEIPKFFKEETQGTIKKLRENTLEKEEEEWLGMHFETLENYEKDTPPEYQSIRTQIANAGIREQREGMLLIKCWANVPQSPPVGGG